MIRINLLPYRTARKKENVRQQVTVFLLLIVLITFSLVWYNNKLNKKVEALNTQIEFTRKEVIRYNKIAKEVEELKNKLAVLKRKLQVIEQLDMNRGRSFRILEGMTEVVIEKKMWLTGLEAIEQNVRPAKKPKKGKKGKQAETTEEFKRPDVNLQIQGIALDNKTVADFMTRLEEDSLFTSVRLINLQQELFKQGKGKDNIHLKKFVVACTNPPTNPSTDNIESEEKEKT
ncbi:MAG: PilN domain-containing protein [Thermodesulfobacteriota bacterium]